MRPAPKPIKSGAIDLDGPPEATYMYRAYCRCGDLLYVGITDSLFRRLSAHRWSKAEWEPRTVRLEWDLHKTRAAALRAETWWIATQDPVYNVQGRDFSQRKPHWHDLPWPTFRDPGATRQERLFHRARALSLSDRIA